MTDTNNNNNNRRILVQFLPIIVWDATALDPYWGNSHRREEDNSTTIYGKGSRKITRSLELLESKNVPKRINFLLFILLLEIFSIYTGIIISIGCLPYCMHVIEHIIMAEKEAQDKAAAAATKKTKPTMDAKRLQALEAKAVAEATATADAAFSPSASLMNASTAAPLLKQVDGPSLQAYEAKESVYVGRSVPVGAGGTLKVPIQVSTPGSVVEYAVENKKHDFAFGITAEREEGVTVVKETDRVDASKTPQTGKFLVGSVPCLIQFSFENDYSWYREKIVSYKVTVTPPSLDTLKAGRRRRAKACLKAVAEDVKSANKRYTSATEQKLSMEKELDALYQQIEQKKKSLAVVKKEESWLKERVTLREAQTKALTLRLEEGWPDELEGGQ